MLLRASIVLIALAATPSAHAQATERAKKEVRAAVDKAAASAKQQAQLRFDSAVQDAAASAVADGAFIAVAAPWTSDDKTKRSRVARFSGTATAYASGSRYTVVLCDDSSARHWTASITLPVNSATPTTGTSESEYEFPNRLVSATASEQGASAGSATAGSLKIATVTQKTVAGVARLKFPRARIAGSSTSVDIGISFNARVDDARGARPVCGRR